MRPEELYIPIKKKSGIPLYMQIKEGLRKTILAAPQGEEMTLPPQRDLASTLGVSRNTVSMAYAELEREGLVASQVGKGTVAVRPAGKAESRGRRERLARAIEHSVEEALSLGFTLDDYSTAVATFLREKKEMLRNIRLVFVECNREQLAYFSEHLFLDPGAMITPVLLGDIRDRPDEMLPGLRSADMVVTSFYHMEELEDLLSDGGPPLVGINLQPEMSTIVKIARIRPEARVGVVAASRQFLAEIGNTLLKMDVDAGRVEETVDTDAMKLRRFVDAVDALIVSPSRRKEIEALAADRDVVEFLFAPDEASVNNIRVALVELKQRRKGGKENAGSDS